MKAGEIWIRKLQDRKIFENAQEFLEKPKSKTWLIGKVRIIKMSRRKDNAELVHFEYIDVGDGFKESDSPQTRGYFLMCFEKLYN